MIETSTARSESPKIGLHCQFLSQTTPLAITSIDQTKSESSLYAAVIFPICPSLTRPHKSGLIFSLIVSTRLSRMAPPLVCVPFCTTINFYLATSLQTQALI
ncbi:unnamed protein product [Kuraishia capsulata CBS 1993]|uniref:Uncharacterized protein n=1 Tax=Kuraishia capsulata CBS 1993 TaxID=1382522 RepID=W6MRA5_9ASCO|nr:uncharacterized protein KUCA_T00005232001 [Kuraishia capsulata CBS 1993]CDK29244.1 unnamed protein product [Kuraishia capsulata CBS 1993]